jgi:hypothetical protein
VVCVVGRGGSYRVLVGKPEGKRPLGRPRCRWEYSCKVDRPEIRWRSVDWLRIGQFVGCCEHGNEPLGSIECLEFIF